MGKLRIKDLCKERGIKLNSLAVQVGISQPSISLIANEKLKPSPDTLERIASSIGVGIGELFTPLEGAKIVCPHCGELVILELSN